MLSFLVHLLWDLETRAHLTMGTDICQQNVLKLFSVLETKNGIYYEIILELLCKSEICLFVETVVRQHVVLTFKYTIK